MDEKTLMQFVQRILSASDNSDAAEASLSELKEILRRQGVSSVLLHLIDSARSGASDSWSIMKASAAEAPALTPEALDNARIRAKEEHERILAEERNNRC